jgi:hypothetical protein
MSIGTLLQPVRIVFGSLNEASASGRDASSRRPPRLQHGRLGEASLPGDGHLLT